MTEHDRVSSWSGVYSVLFFIDPRIAAERKVFLREPQYDTKKKMVLENKVAFVMLEDWEDNEITSGFFWSICACLDM